jgi:hypothetical protein
VEYSSAVHVIVRISSIIVPESLYNLHLTKLQSAAIPQYEAAAGLVSVSLLQRPFVAYVELLTISLWVTEKAMTSFLEGQPLVEGVRSEEIILLDRGFMN